MSRSHNSPRLLLIALALLALTGCSKSEPPAAAPTQILRISQRNEPADLDPQLAALPDEFFVLRAINEGLVTPAPDGHGVLPGVAERWETSADGLRWTFHLRVNARWSNGDAVTAHDFVYSFRRVLTPTLAAPKAQLFFPLKNAAAYYRGELHDFAQVGVAAFDDRTLVLTLEHATPHLLALAASPPWLPVHPATVEKFGGGTQRGTAWTRPENSVGNGPFTLRAWRPNREITVVKSATYWDAAHVRLAGIRFIAMDNGDAEERAFRAGQLDVTLAVPAPKLPFYEKAQPAVLRRVSLAETRYLAVNTQRAPLNDPRVRRALALVIDRAALTEKVQMGGQQPALNYLPPGLGGYESAAKISGTPAEARELLAAAGFPDGRGFPKLELSTWVNTPVLEAIQQMWKQELNIVITLAQREGKVHLAALGSGNCDLGFMPAIPDYNDPASLLGELTTGTAGNYPHWSNADYDRLVAEAGHTTDPASRTALYREAEAILLAELPVIPLYFNTQNFLLSPRVRGWQTDRLWTRFYQSVSLE